MIIIALIIALIILLLGVLFHYVYINTYYNDIDFDKMEIIKLSQGGYKLIYKNTYIFKRYFSIVMNSKFKEYEYTYETLIKSDVEKLKNGDYKLKRSGELVEIKNEVSLGKAEGFIKDRFGSNGRN